MYSLPKNVYRERKDFSKIKTTVPIPNLIEIQRKSYERFLQMSHAGGSAGSRSAGVAPSGPAHARCASSTALTSGSVNARQGQPRGR
jgi:DNA-directed RNA polymerase beta subunit